jgi:hypothetical protein
VGQSVTQTLTITPTPATSLNFTIKTPPDFSVVGGSTFTAQQPVTVTIQFTPDSPGSKGGTATISAQNGGGSMSLSVLGAGYYDTAIPHSVSGGGFLSRLFVVNLSQSSNNVIIERYTQAGTMVQTQQEKLAPQASLAIADSEATRSTALTIQWLRIYSEHPVTASVVFDELTGQSPTIMGTLSSPALTTFSAPVLYGTGFNGGIAVSDLSGTANVLTINLLDAIGTLKASRVLPLPGNGQLAEVVDDSQLFHDFLTSQGITVQSNSHFTGALSVQSTGPVAALMVGSENRQLFSLPVTPLVFAAAQQLLPNGFIAASNYQTVIPHSVAGGGFITRVLVNNLANAANAIAIYRFSQNGSLVNQTQQTIAPGGSYLLAGDQSERSLPSAAITWFAIASDQQVSASVLFDDEFQNTGSAVGSLSSAALTNFSVPLQITAAGATVGVALVNLSGSSSLVALTLVDSNGTALASNTLSLPAYNQTAFPLTTANQIPAIKNALCPAGVCQDFAGSLVVTTSPRQPVAALVLGFDGGHFYSLPVTQTPGL